jgi:uncharacterized membrane protein YvbJ
MSKGFHKHIRNHQKHKTIFMTSIVQIQVEVTLLNALSESFSNMQIYVKTFNNARTLHIF